MRTVITVNLSSKGTQAGMFSTLRSMQNSTCDCPPGFYEAWKTNKIRLRGVGSLANVTVYSAGLQSVLFSSNGPVKMDPDHTIDLSNGDASLFFDVPLIVIRARDSTATRVEKLEIWNYLEDIWEYVPKYSNFDLFTDTLQPDLDPDPMRYLQYASGEMLGFFCGFILPQMWLMVLS